MAELQVKILFIIFRGGISCGGLGYRVIKRKINCPWNLICIKFWLSRVGGLGTF